MTGTTGTGKPSLREEQRLVLTDRSKMTLSGVEDVVSFDETGAVFRTGLGTLAIDGEGLHVVKLDLAGGDVEIEGKVNGLFYSEAGGAKSRAKRLFR